LSEVTLQGPDIVLRDLRGEDARALFELSRETAVTRFLTWDSPGDISETEAFIATALRRQRESPGSCHHFCITLRETGEPIGCTSLDPVDLRHRHATIGSWIGRPFWGRGHMRETKALVLDHAFGPLGLERVQALSDLDNQRSLGSLESCGFRREGICRRSMRRGDLFVSQAVMAILAGEHEPLVRAELGRAPQLAPAQV